MMFKVLIDCVTGLNKLAAVQCEADHNVGSSPHQGLIALHKRFYFDSGESLLDED